MDFFAEGLSVEASAMTPAALPPNKRRELRIKLFIKNFLKVVFLFSFVLSYVFFFGTSEAVIGVCLATSFLMIVRVDIGVAPAQATLVVFYSFIHIGIFTTIANLNPALGLVVHALSIYFLMTITGYRMIEKSYFPFITTYILSTGSPTTTFEGFGIRMLGLTIGGLSVATVYYLVHRNNSQKRSIIDLFKEIHLTSTRNKFVLRLTLGLTIGMFIGSFFSLHKPAWISMTVNSLTMPFIAETKKRIFQRLLGTLIGSVIFIVLFEFILPDFLHVWMLVLTVFISLFITNYTWSMVFVTLNSLNGGLVFYSAEVAAEYRFIWIAVGIVIVIAMNLISKLNPLDRFSEFLEKKKEERLQAKSN